MEKLSDCNLHSGKINELVCKTCGLFLCPECVSTHGMRCASPSYAHILSYAKNAIFPMMDTLLTALDKKETYFTSKSEDFVSSLHGITGPLKITISSFIQYAEALKEMVEKLEKYETLKSGGGSLARMKKEIEKNKKKLEKSIQEKKTKEVIRLAIKARAEVEMAKIDQNDETIVKSMRTGISAVGLPETMKQLIDSLQVAITRCEQLTLEPFSKADWTIDRNYLSAKMTLSPDNLMYGNCSGIGYPAIIGNLPFEKGTHAFEVIPMGLDCNGKEGFGIIDLAKYKEIFAKDPVTPTCYSLIIGYLHRGQAMNMETIEMSDMVMNKKYVVIVNMNEGKVTIKGERLSLKGTLNPGSIYVPVFCAGCRGNRFKVKRIDAIEDEEKLA